MASNQDIEGAKENTASGHTIQYSVRYHNFVKRLPFIFERSFHFDCNATPTLWRFRVHFKINPEDNTLFCTISVIRTDEHPKSVAMELWMKLAAAPLQHIPPIKFHCNIMRSRCVVEKTFYGIMQYQDRRQIEEQGLLVQVSFAVRGCHMDKDLKQLITRRMVGNYHPPRFGLCSKM